MREAFLLIILGTLDLWDRCPQADKGIYFEVTTLELQYTINYFNQKRFPEALLCYTVLKILPNLMI